MVVVLGPEDLHKKLAVDIFRTARQGPNLASL